MKQTVDAVNLVTILVGPPCTGKTTYLKGIPHDYVVSSDNIVDKLCQEHKISYRDYFGYSHKSRIKKKRNALFKEVIEASKNYSHVVWDLTNLKRVNRKQIMSYYPRAIFNAIVFDFTGNEQSLLKLNKKRYTETGKFIQEKVLHEMFKSFQPVKLNEGFTKVTDIPARNFTY
jgi:predicted kinase